MHVAVAEVVGFRQASVGGIVEKDISMMKWNEKSLKSNVTTLPMTSLLPVEIVMRDEAATT